MAGGTDISPKKEKIPTYRYIATTVHGKTVQGVCSQRKWDKVGL